MGARARRRPTATAVPTNNHFPNYISLVRELGLKSEVDVGWSLTPFVRSRRARRPRARVHVVFVSLPRPPLVSGPKNRHNFHHELWTPGPRPGYFGRILLR